MHSSIGPGILILLGIAKTDTETAAISLAERCLSSRIFSDIEGKMNLSLKEVQGEAMVVSQFTLYGYTRKGNRPSYTDAAEPAQAETLYETFVGTLKRLHEPQKVKSGVFRAMMQVELVNDGPVTIMIESKD